MKKMFIFFLLLLYIICLTGCKENDEKINIEFIVDGISHIVQIDKGSSITKEVVPLNDNIVDFELYYDENMINEYLNDKLYCNVKIYVKFNNDDKNLLLNKQLLLYLENEFIKESMIFLDFSLEDKIEKLKKGLKNQYLIDYMYNNKLYCGYIDSDIIKKIEDMLWIRGDNSLYSFNRFILNNGIDFNFEDIKWVSYDNDKDILYEFDNYKLKFIYKFNDVLFIEDIYGEKINQIIPHIISLDFSISEDKIKLNNYDELDEGKYFLYGSNNESFENITFNQFHIIRQSSKKYENYYLQKINEENLIKDCIDYFENGSHINMLEVKYGAYANYFYNTIKNEEIKGNSTFGYWDYENYKSILKEILNEERM